LLNIEKDRDRCLDLMLSGFTDDEKIVFFNYIKRLTPGKHLEEKKLSKFQ
jgi:hypothetical protein